MLFCENRMMQHILLRNIAHFAGVPEKDPKSHTRLRHPKVLGGENRTHTNDFFAADHACYCLSKVELGKTKCPSYAFVL